MKTRLAETDACIAAAADVLLELRPAFTRAGLIAQIEAQRRNGYQLACTEENGAVLCVAGFVIGTKLAWGKHIYVDDLVTAEAHRSRGAGAAMLAWLEDYARAEGCGQLHLDSGVQRFRAHRFYLREGFVIASHHFSITELDREPRREATIGESS